MASIRPKEKVTPPLHGVSHSRARSMTVDDLKLTDSVTEQKSESLMWVIPCLVTASALACGLSAVRAASEANFT